jgi:hypothetical protein
LLAVGQKATSFNVMRFLSLLRRLAEYAPDHMKFGLNPFWDRAERRMSRPITQELFDHFITCLGALKLWFHDLGTGCSCNPMLTGFVEEDTKL